MLNIAEKKFKSQVHRLLKKNRVFIRAFVRNILKQYFKAGLTMHQSWCKKVVSVENKPNIKPVVFSKTKYFPN